ncbi:MAG: heavy metal sensor histidine kinase [Geobacteraceae bacterium]|nr:heavy metal sensor histidine kinase [Geobacteraceae bacterium]NTW79817.1 heavy metal sensor histidine kinase [Geobacteraceae bacterium]
MPSEDNEYFDQCGTIKTCRLSLTMRLVLVYAISAITLLLISTAFLHTNINNILETAESNYIDDRYHVFRAVIETQPDFVDVIKQVIEWEGVYAAFPEYYARIQVRNAGILIETLDMDKLIPTDKFPDTYKSKIKEDPKKHFLYKGNNGRSYLLKSFWADTLAPSQRIEILIAKDVTAETDLIAKKHRIIVSILMVLILFAIFFSFVVARKVLTPLGDLAKVANLITLDKIGLRIKDPTCWPVELRSSAIAFNSMLDRLKNSFAQISEYTANLAHELRTPVNNLMGEAEIALSKERTPEEYRMVLESGHDEHMRLMRMIDALLFMARGENPANQIENSLFDPMNEIEKVCCFNEALVEEKQAQISSNGEGLIYGDPTLFCRVMNNLVSNALYYSSPGVKISISVIKSRDGYIDVVVSDTGHGISEEDLNHVFDRFYRVMSSRSSYPQGSGLGLSIVKFIMQLHKGTVTIQSILGQGTTVTLHFPAHHTKSG